MSVSGKGRMDGKEVWQSFEDEVEGGGETGNNKRGKGGGVAVFFFCSREGFRSRLSLARASLPLSLSLSLFLDARLARVKG